MTLKFCSKSEAILPDIQVVKNNINTREKERQIKSERKTRWRYIYIQIQDSYFNNFIIHSINLLEKLFTADEMNCVSLNKSSHSLELGRILQKFCFESSCI